MDTDTANKFCNILTTALDNVAPLKTKKVKSNSTVQKSSRIDEGLRKEMALTRRKKRLFWKKLKTEQSFEEFAQQKKHFGQVVCKRIKSYYHNIFTNCKNSYK